jgi:hypothetical protein
MTTRRLSAATSLVLLLVLTVAVAEASLLGLLFVFSDVLRLSLTVQVGSQLVGAVNPQYASPRVTVFNAAAVGSLLFTAACGIATAWWRASTWHAAR